MRNYIFILILLCCSFQCAAQKLKRHEVTLGLYSSYFFDETPIRFEWLKGQNRTWLPTFSYSYHFDTKHKISFTYGEQYYAYNFGEIAVGAKPFVKLRVLRHYKLAVSRILKSYHDINFSGELGIAYRRGGRIKFIECNFAHCFSEHLEYNNLGLTTGFSVQHPIYKQFFGELSANYFFYFSSFDRHLLMPSYKIGIRF